MASSRLFSTCVFGLLHKSWEWIVCAFYDVFLCSHSIIARRCEKKTAMWLSRLLDYMYCTYVCTFDTEITVYSTYVGCSDMQVHKLNNPRLGELVAWTRGGCGTKTVQFTVTTPYVPPFDDAHSTKCRNVETQVNERCCRGVGNYAPMITITDEAFTRQRTW